MAQDAVLSLSISQRACPPDGRNSAATAGRPNRAFRSHRKSRQTAWRSVDRLTIRSPLPGAVMGGNGRAGTGTNGRGSCCGRGRRTGACTIMEARLGAAGLVGARVSLLCSLSRPARRQPTVPGTHSNPSLVPASSTRGRRRGAAALFFSFFVRVTFSRVTFRPSMTCLRSLCMARLFASTLS
jgi:hypothetical protein